MDSYSVRCIFLWEPRPGQKSKNLYEERITLWQAQSLDHAIELAEQEAEVYADQDSVFLGYSLAYALYDAVPASGVEIFSLLRESDLEPEDYLDAFFDTGTERTQKHSPNE